MANTDQSIRDIERSIVETAILLTAVSGAQLEQARLIEKMSLSQRELGANIQHLWTAFNALNERLNLMEEE